MARIRGAPCPGAAMKRDIDDLALFGGEPLFAEPRPIGQLDSPDLDDYLALVRKAFANRHLTNGGQLVQALEERLAGEHQVRHCVSVANAGLGLMMLMQIFGGGRPGEVVMPAFSYRGLPHFARWAGLEPRYCDVDPATHGLDPRAVAAAIGPATTSILGVCNANSPGDIDGLCEVAGQAGIPIFFDSVYALGSTYQGRPLGGSGRAEVFSIHATKLLNGFEGGYVTTNDDGLADLLRWQRNFSLPALRPPGAADADHVIGLNAKLNELHAAMALCSLERLDGVIDRNRRRYKAYREHCVRIPGVSVLPYLDDHAERRNYQIVILDIADAFGCTRDHLLAVLRAEGCAIGPYYSPPLHRWAPARELPDLPVTDHLAGRLLQLPVGEMVDHRDIERLGELLAFVAGNAERIAARLTKEIAIP